MPRHKGAILVTLIHEIAHTLRRISCSTYSESKNIFTPKNGEFLFKIHEENEKTERSTQNERGEAGFLAEKLIFGNVVTKMNDLAAEILFNHSMNNLEDFQIQFKNKNKKLNAEFVNLARGKYVFFGNRRCGLSGKTKYNL